MNEQINYEELSAKTILKYIDDFSIYSYYIGEELELGVPYSSPLRVDNHPSFSLFYAGKKIRFKDFALGKSGDVFDFVQLLLKKELKREISHSETLKHIDKHLNLGLYYERNPNIKPFKASKPIRQYKDIKITSKRPETKEYWDYWGKYGIEKEVLKEYNVSQIEIVHYLGKKKKYYFPKTLGIAYRITNRFKLYFPYETKDKKFQNNFLPEYVEGFLQLKYVNDFCIITKSMKEVMFFRQHFDWDTVAGKSETIRIPNYVMSSLFKKYKFVLIWLDNDETGKRETEKYLKEYPSLIPVSFNVKEKDPTDYWENNYDKEKVKREIKQLIWKKLGRL